MQKTTQSIALARAIAASLFATGIANAQQTADSSAALETVTVTSPIIYRDRTEATAPTLVYDLEYFQQFEPRTVGDMLKRVPSVAFLSDTLEYDGARLRGLDPGYTQILINGKTVPGGLDDRSFFVDRIPAEIVERIEIVRSPSANRSGDAVAGAINIVLRDAYEFNGGYVRAGVSHFRDGEIKPTLAGVASGEIAGGRGLIGYSHQGRYNPKQKLSLRYESPDGEFTDREEQQDTRDGTDDSLNLSWKRKLGPGELSLSGVYVRTDRDETEHSREFGDRTGSGDDFRLSTNDQHENIRQDNGSFGVDYKFEALGGTFDIDVDWARFKEDVTTTEEETSFDDEEMPHPFDEREGTREIGNTRDTERSAKIAHKREIAAGTTMEFGVDWNDKNREGVLRTSEVDTDEEGAPLPPYAEFDLQSSHVEERRLDPYLMFSGKHGVFDWETGLRYETTDVDIRGDEASYSNEYKELLPSAHLRWNLSEADRLNFSVARSLRRPNFNYLRPTFLEGEYGDNDFIGNPLLDPETAWGVDLGFEHRLGRRGVIGVNAFYRKIKNLIEIANTGDPSETAIGDFEDEVEEFLEENPGATPATPGYPAFDPDSWVYTARNVGDGKVYGVEFDLSTPLTALGLPDTGLFFNYSWLDSETDDFLGRRSFNDQPRYVLNLGFIHDIPSIESTFGLSYRRQGTATSRVLAEEVKTTYGPDLEAFVEKRFGKDWTVRLTGQNLLNGKKREYFNKFDALDDQIDRDFDEYEIESEQSGRTYQLVVRYAF